MVLLDRNGRGLLHEREREHDREWAMPITASAERTITPIHVPIHTIAAE